MDDVSLCVQRQETAGVRPEIQGESAEEVRISSKKER